MNMSLYCKNQGMTLDQYKQYQANIKATAEAIILNIKQSYKTGTGMYHNVNEILKSDKNETYYYILQELKNQSVEFINNNTEWRY